MSQQITVTAQSMLHAQGFRITADQRAILVAKADRYRAITGETGLTDISIPVVDLDGAPIGKLTYLL